MNYENKINSFYAELPPEERKRIKKEVMTNQNLKADKSFHAQRYGKSELSLSAGLIWADVLGKEVKEVFVLVR
jgi:hypothetical protein